MSDMFDCAELLARHKIPKGPRLAIITNAGGPGVMATDALLERGGTLAELSKETLARLNEQLPSAWSHGNPIDVLGDASPERLGKALQLVLEDRGVDAVIALFAPQAVSQPTEAAKAVIEVARHTSKPVLASWMGGKTMQEATALFNKAGIPTYRARRTSGSRVYVSAFLFAESRAVVRNSPRYPRRVSAGPSEVAGGL